jgi:hypothetical protein
MAVVGPTVFFASIPAALQIGSGDSVLGQNEALVAPILGNLPSAWPAFAPYAHLATYTVLAVLALVIGWLVWRAGPARKSLVLSERTDQDILAYGIALCGLLLLVPTAWVHHYVWVLPGVVLAFGAVMSLKLARVLPSRSEIALIGLLLLAVVLLDLNLPYAWDTELHPAVTTFAGLPLRPLALEVRAIGAVLLAAILAFVTAGTANSARAQGATPKHVSSVSINGSS